MVLKSPPSSKILRSGLVLTVLCGAIGVKLINNEVKQSPRKYGCYGHPRNLNSYKSSQPNKDRIPDKK